MPEKGQIKEKYIEFSYLIEQLSVQHPKLVLNGVPEVNLYEGFKSSTKSQLRICSLILPFIWEIALL